MKGGAIVGGTFFCISAFGNFRTFEKLNYEYWLLSFKLKT